MLFLRKHSELNPIYYPLGMWAWVLHRITGVIIALYALAHITVLSTALIGSSSFNEVMRVLFRPLVLWLELGLLAAIIIHGLNGIRLILFDLGIGARFQKQIFVFSMIFGFLIFLGVFFKTLPYLLVGI